MHAVTEPQAAGERAREIRLSEVIAALSFALDLAEGQPEGHALKSCLLGMRLAEEVRLPARDRSALFYALLLKDAGCSSISATVCSLFAADDRLVKFDLKTTDWTSLIHAFRYLTRNLYPQGSPLERAWRVVTMGLQGSSPARRLVRTRVERSAQVVRALDLPEETARAILSLEEHWDGRGHPEGLKGEATPLPARIAGLAQVVEVFFTRYGVEEAVAMARERRGKWFDPALVDALVAVRGDKEFWGRLGTAELHAEVGAAHPDEPSLLVDDPRLDRVAETFARVIDTKSPWTYRHSEGVAEVATGIGEVLGLTPDRLRDLRRGALMHDIGKLGISNLILDKAANLSPAERAEVRRHPEYTQRILARVSGFDDLADWAAAHHERLDGRGYHRGLGAEQLSLEARVLAVADIYDALAAQRPYREPLPRERVLEIMCRDVGSGICPDCFDALCRYLSNDKVTR